MPRVHHSIQHVSSEGTALRRPYAALDGLVVATAIWCVLHELRILPGLLAETLGFVAWIMAGALIATTSARRIVWRLCVIGLVAVAAIALSPVARWLSASWVRVDPLGSPVGAVVVLSGGMSVDSALGNASIERLLHGFEVIQAKRIPLLVLTRIERWHDGQRIVSDWDQARLLAMLGNGVAVLTTEVVNDTHDEAVESARVLSARGIRRVAVVTSTMHTRRACATFEAAGLSVRCVASRPRDHDGSNLEWPGARLATFGAWVYEALGMVKYRAKGWLG